MRATRHDQHLPRSSPHNPPIADRVNTFNAALLDADGGVHYRVHPDCERLLEDFDMTKFYATFSGGKYHSTTHKIALDAPRLGADKLLVYDDYWLETHRPEFRKAMDWFHTHHATRGYGWFTWKPFVILDAMDRMENGDIVLYTDADTFPIADLNPLYDTCAKENGVMLFRAEGCTHAHWCKRDCYLLMGMDRPEYQNVTAGVARFMLFQKGGLFDVERFLYEWLAYTCTPLTNTFDPSILAPELPQFKEGRAEQAVLTNLAYKYGVPMHREACEFGNGGTTDWEIYPQTFIQYGGRSYAPGTANDDSLGSAFRNVND